MHTDILSGKDRRAICDFLFEKASDEDLLELAQQTKSRFLRVQGDLTDIKKFVGVGRFSAVAPVATEVKDVGQEKPEKAVAKGAVEGHEVHNISPPGTPSKRIGSGTKDTIMRLLAAKPRTSAQINAGLNGVQANTEAVLKLLWDRKELKFDGQNFYV